MQTCPHSSHSLGVGSERLCRCGPAALDGPVAGLLRPVASVGAATGRLLCRRKDPGGREGEVGGEGPGAGGIRGAVDEGGEGPEGRGGCCGVCVPGVPEARAQAAAERRVERQSHEVLGSAVLGAHDEPRLGGTGGRGVRRGIVRTADSTTPRDRNRRDEEKRGIRSARGSCSKEYYRCLRGVRRGRATRGWREAQRKGEEEVCWFEDEKHTKGGGRVPRRRGRTGEGMDKGQETRGGGGPAEMRGGDGREMGMARGLRRVCSPVSAGTRRQWHRRRLRRRPTRGLWRLPQGPRRGSAGRSRRGRAPPEGSDAQAPASAVLRAPRAAAHAGAGSGEASTRAPSALTSAACSFPDTARAGGSRVGIGHR